MKQEQERLLRLKSLEDLAEKKLKIYSRVLMDANIAGDMERLACRAAQRKLALESLVYGEPLKGQKNKNGGGRYETNGGDEQE